jgi:hypothetical protein
MGTKWQVINESGHPASNDFDWLCIFPTAKKAKDWVKYLKEECGCANARFRIRLVQVSPMYNDGVMIVQGEEEILNNT